MTDMLLIATLVAVILNIIITVLKKPVSKEDINSVKNELSSQFSQNISSTKTELDSSISNSRIEQASTMQSLMTSTIEVLTKTQNQSISMQDKRLLELTQSLSERVSMLEKIVGTNLEQMRIDNASQLEKMRLTVDEKLEKTLETRISASFSAVNERLKEVYEGLGEMKTLATGVGDLKKVLTNVKTRGIIGEYQLGAIIEEILSPEQYEENITTKKGASTRVEFAIKLPGDGSGTVYLPVDAKFPGDAYVHLVDAYDSGDVAEIAKAKKALIAVITQSARDIHDKYIDPPNTTDFAIMFLPFEGLYAEVVREGLVEDLQRKYKVNIAGPTTFAALLNSLQMGFRTLAIQKRSSEVWNVLGAVKTEFTKFEDVLNQAQLRMTQTSAELDKLVGVRTRQINSKLRTVAELELEE